MCLLIGIVSQVSNVAHGPLVCKLFDFLNMMDFDGLVFFIKLFIFFVMIKLFVCFSNDEVVFVLFVRIKLVVCFSNDEVV